MKGQFLIAQHGAPVAHDIYADKSALVLEWILLEGIEKEVFSVREAAIESTVSLGLVQRVFQALVHDGSLVTVGLRTAKKFRLKDPGKLLRGWLDRYSITHKCKVWTYRSGLAGRNEILNTLKHATFAKKISLALHSAAEMHGCKNTNLHTVELYLTDPNLKTLLEKKLQLEPQERGYEVLLISPFYKSMLNGAKSVPHSLRPSPAFLTFIDLYNFPLRGREQAEFMAERIPTLKRIYKKG